MTPRPGQNPAGRLEVPSDVLAGLQAEAEAAWPLECCGLLVGYLDDASAAAEGLRVWRVVRAVPSPNTAPEAGPDGHGRHDRFEIAPEVLLATLRACAEDGQGMAVIGHYHSHPDAPAEPSPTDQANAFYADHAWLIFSVEAGRVTAATAWTPAHACDTTPPPFLPLSLATL